MKKIDNVQYIAAMNPTAGSFFIIDRMQRHFCDLRDALPRRGGPLATSTADPRRPPRHLQRRASQASCADAVINATLVAPQARSPTPSCRRPSSSTTSGTCASSRASSRASLKPRPRLQRPDHAGAPVAARGATRVYGDRLVNDAQTSSASRRSSKRREEPFRGPRQGGAAPRSRRVRDVREEAEGDEKLYYRRRLERANSKTPHRQARRVQRGERDDGPRALRPGDGARLPHLAHHRQPARQRAARRRRRLGQAVAHAARGLHRRLRGLPAQADVRRTAIDRLQGGPAQRST